ncbi:hypothetical protein BC941DRAFT_456812 [Chlamydoabsidia padenii]|nr:hypothetical protein BC941DRAFT_456812 [Chlamydoabsidia padenii]
MSLNDTLQEIRSIFEVDQSTTKETYLANEWVLVTKKSVALAALNKPEGIKEVYHYISNDIDAMNGLNSETKLDFKTQVILKLQEAIFKCLVAYGCPKTIITLFTLSNVIPEEIQSRLPQQPVRKDWHPDQKQHGIACFNKIYGDKAESARQIMYKIYPDLGNTIETYIYPALVSENSIITPKETSLIMVAAIFAQQVLPLLKGHQEGAKSNGVKDVELENVYAVVRALATFYNLGDDLISETVAMI